MIVDALAVQFSNRQIRPLADRLSQLYYFARKAVDEWDAAKLAGVIPNSNDEVIADGADKDGRVLVTGFAAHTVIELAQAFIADYEGGSNAKLNSVLAVAVNISK